MAEQLTPEVIETIPTASGPAASQVAGQLIKSGETMAQVSTKSFTAVSCQVKRKAMAQIAPLMKAEAMLAGAHFFYKWPVRKKDGTQDYVVGPSIDLATTFVRLYGNCTTDLDEIITAPGYIAFKSYFIDLESGATWTNIWKEKKSAPLGGMQAARGEVMDFQKAQSKALRNVIMKAVPGWLIDSCIAAAERAELQRSGEDLEKSRSGIVKWASGYGITQVQLEDHFQKPMDQWTAQDVTDMKAQALAIKDGAAFITDIFPSDGPTGKKPQDKPWTHEAKPPQEKKLPTDPPTGKAQEEMNRLGIQQTPAAGAATGEDELTAEDRRDQLASSARPPSVPLAEQPETVPVEKATGEATGQSNWFEALGGPKGETPMGNWINLRSGESFKKAIMDHAGDARAASLPVKQRLTKKWRDFVNLGKVSGDFPLSGAAEGVKTTPDMAPDGQEETQGNEEPNTTPGTGNAVQGQLSAPGNSTHRHSPTPSDTAFYVDTDNMEPGLAMTPAVDTLMELCQDDKALALFAQYKVNNGAPKTLAEVEDALDRVTLDLDQLRAAGSDDKGQHEGPPE